MACLVECRRKPCQTLTYKIGSHDWKRSRRSQLKAGYCEYCDHQYYPKGIANLFVEDGLWEGEQFGRHVGREQIKAFFAKVSSEIVFAAHLVLNPIIEIENPGHASGRWRLVMSATVRANGANEAHWLVGAYDDRYVRVDGIWLFQSLKTPRELFHPSARQLGGNRGPVSFARDSPPASEVGMLAVPVGCLLERESGAAGLRRLEVRRDELEGDGRSRIGESAGKRDQKAGDQRRIFAERAHHLGRRRSERLHRNEREIDRPEERPNPATDVVPPENDLLIVHTGEAAADVDEAGKSGAVLTLSRGTPQSGNQSATIRLGSGETDLANRCGLRVAAGHPE